MQNIFDSDTFRSIYYHDCVIHLFRPFVRVTFKEGTKSPRRICTEEAITISQIMEIYSTSYGLRRGHFIANHCIMSAAIIHLLNMSSPGPNSITATQTADYLRQAIRVLHEMRAAYPIVARYLNLIHSLAMKWNVNLPPNIHHALEAVDIPSPISSNSNPPVSPEQELSRKSSYTNGDRKHSAPQLLQLPSDGNVGIQTPGSQQFLWTPFPETTDGLPVVAPQSFASTTGGMDISNMLDVEDDGNWAQLNRDGFAIDLTDFGTPLWDVN
jgi:hypothetical protein